MAGASFKLASPKPIDLVASAGTAPTRVRCPPPASVAVQPAAVPVSLRISSFGKVLEALIDRADFSVEEAEATLRLLLEEENEARIAAFLVLLRAKGETYEEIVGLAKAMLSCCVLVDRLDDCR